MISNIQLFSVGNFQFRLQHLLIIGVLAIAFSIAVMIRSQAADYGFELNEFDPFFNYRATKFLIENGLEEYYNWHDDMSWYPNGRDISSTSQVMLHITAATLYPIFGSGSSVYDFTIIFPVVIGSLTTIVVFALVRVIGGTTAGLFSALFYSISVPIIVRGTIGWFKSEPMGLFYGLLGLYLFLSGIKSENRKIAIAKIIGGGVFIGFGLSAWGGIQFFLIPLGLFFLALPFFRKDHNFLLVAIPIFSATILLTSLLFDRPTTGFVTGLGGFALIGPSAFLAVCIFIQKLSKEEKRIRNSLLLLSGTVLGGIAILASNSIGGSSFRYLNALNPFLTTQNALVDSVAEHSTTTTAQSFYFLSIFMIFAGIGIWLLFRNQNNTHDKPSFRISNDMIAFSLIIGFVGVYVSSAFIRLELFASISVILLSSLGLAIITHEFFKKQSFDKKKFSSSQKSITKIVYVAIIVILFIVPLSLPNSASWVLGVKGPPTILNGGTNYNIATSDWPDALAWLKNNTPEDSVVAAWWDYGYWITTLGERTSLADNATMDPFQIEKIAKMFLSTPDDAWRQLNEFGADYILVYVAATRITGEGQDPTLYLLQGGADESKKQWFMRIAGEPVSKYVHPDGTSGTNFFWDNTVLGKLFPYTPVAYANFATNQQLDRWQAGYTPVYVKDIKYSSDGDGPFKLAFSSPSFDSTNVGAVSGVLIYEVNKNYQPQEKISEPTQEVQQTSDSAIVSTAFGDITIQLYENIAPNTVANYKELANSGFYDGTIFHRIVPGFVIQGGDPNTISGPRDTWGQGGPGYSIDAELSDLKHKKYTVSMARGSDINSAGSQFFIVLDDAPWLDNKYTIFGEVTSGFDVVDKIAALETNSNDQPIDPSQTKIEKITIVSP